MAGGAFVLIVARLSQLTTKDVMRIAALEHQVMRDALTGAFNRRYLETMLDKEVLRAHRANCPLSVLIVDLDHFKNINDTYGHPIGDEVIRHVYRMIHSQTRSSDAVVRYGGEEFVIVALDNDLRAASALGNRMLRQISDRTVGLSDGSKVTVTVSIGVAQLELGETSDRMLSRADEALYAAKRNGRNRLEVADERQAINVP
jgi:diguanylate cyclase (GGDEF)-like protein